MKWVRDAAGRLAERPHYDPAELDRECETLVSALRRDRQRDRSDAGGHARARLALTTDDLTVLLEAHTSDLDLYADLTTEGPGVEAVTEFIRTGKPRVRVSAALSEAPSRAHRLRTTLAHELGHVRFHAFLWSGGGLGGAVAGVKCRRDSIARPRHGDWLEWQAGYACGAILMPALALDAAVRPLLGPTPVPLFFRTTAARRLVTTIARTFDVSTQAAQVRLLQSNHLTREVPAAAKVFRLPLRAG